MGAGLFLREVPDDYHGPVAGSGDRGANRTSGRECTLGEALRTWQCYAVWTLLFLLASVGNGIVSQASPMLQEATGVSPSVAAGIIGLLCLANAAGRLGWAALSDVVGRRQVYLALFLLQLVAFGAMPLTNSSVVFGLLASLVMLCFGGAWGTLPALVADYFGPKHVGSICGLMLTAAGLSGLFGPTLIAGIYERTGSYQAAFYVLAALMLVGLVVASLIRSPHPRHQSTGG